MSEIFLCEIYFLLFLFFVSHLESNYLGGITVGNTVYFSLKWSVYCQYQKEGRGRKGARWWVACTKSVQAQQGGGAHHVTVRY